MSCQQLNIPQPQVRLQVVSLKVSFLVRQLHSFERELELELGAALYTCCWHFPKFLFSPRGSNEVTDNLLSGSNAEVTDNLFSCCAWLS